MVRVAPRGPLPSGGAAAEVQRGLDDCARFRADTAAWLEKAFPGKGLGRAVAPELDTFVRGPTPRLFGAPEVEAPAPRPPPPRRASPTPAPRAPVRAPSPAPAADPARLAARGIDLDRLLPEVGRPDPNASGKLLARRLQDNGELREAKEEEALGDGNGRIVRRNQEAEYLEDINAYETYRADRHWYDDYLLNRDRYRDDRFRINENQSDERRFLDRNADERRMNDLADERRAETSRLARRDYEASADRLAEERRARDADTARRDYERELERRRNNR